MTCTDYFKLGTKKMTPYYFIKTMWTWSFHTKYKMASIHNEIPVHIVPTYSICTVKILKLFSNHHSGFQLLREHKRLLVEVIIEVAG